MGQRADEVRRHEFEVRPADRHAGTAPDTEHARQSHDHTSPEEIRSDIEQTRAEMSETVDAIQERLSPQRLAEQAKATAYDATIGRTQQAARGAGSSLLDTIKQHPIPAALAGLSIGYLVMQRSGGNQPHDQSHGPLGSTTDSAQERAGQMTSQARGTAEQYGREAREQVQQYSDQARQQASQATGWFQQTLHENPLALGAGTLILGLAVGLVVPETRKEHALMGDARDSLLQQAQATAQDTMQRAQRVAEEAKDTAKQEAKKEGLAG